MRRSHALILPIALLALAGCSTAPKAVYSSIDEVTLEKLAEATTPVSILAAGTPMSVTSLYENTGNESMDGAETNVTYVKNGDLIEVNEFADYPDGYYTHLYYSNDPEDAKLYADTNAGKQSVDIDASAIVSYIETSVLSYSEEGAAIVSSEEVDGQYILTVERVDDASWHITDVITLDPVTGHILQTVTTYVDEAGEPGPTRTNIYNYSDQLAIDRSIKEVADTVSDVMPFTASDIAGEPLDAEQIASAKVIMVNFWEPWCGPCVGEMPDLQKLYEAYKDQGLLILGVFSTFDQEAEAKEILSDAGITYPILRCDSGLAAFRQDYVPATFFTDNTGRLLTAEPYIGAKSYDQWEEIIKEFLAA